VVGSQSTVRERCKTWRGRSSTGAEAEGRCYDDSQQHEPHTAEQAHQIKPTFPSTEDIDVVVLTIATTIVASDAFPGCTKTADAMVPSAHTDFR
jgi:hypothetical protein